jgi:molybdopterin synthase sulfur carrier subunit
VSAVVRVVLPAHLKNLARVQGEVRLRLDGSGAGADGGADGAADRAADGAADGAVTRAALLDALESAYPVLRGTIRDHVTGRRRAFVRFYACEQDLSNEPADAPLPAAVAAGSEPFLIVGAMAGG